MYGRCHSAVPLFLNGFPLLTAHSRLLAIGGLMAVEARGILSRNLLPLLTMIAKTLTYPGEKYRLGVEGRGRGQS